MKNISRILGFKRVISNANRSLSSHIVGDKNFQLVDDKTLIDVLRDSCEINDSKVMCSMMMEGVEFTYGEMLEKAEKLATGLISLGHKQGDRIGIWGPNQSQWLISCWAVAMAGMQLVTINPMYTAKVNNNTGAVLLCSIGT